IMAGPNILREKWSHAMCGEIEAEVPLERQILNRFIEVARARLAPHRERATAVFPGGAAHMEQVFSSALALALADVEAAGEGATLEQLAAQAVVFARLSGLLAGQLPPELNALPQAMDALLVGYREAADHEHDHDHDHEHDHGHHRH
ncbi:MAG: hypothetical protein ACREDZ_10725, partial [Kiloniellales bacterium]